MKEAGMIGLGVPIPDHRPTIAEALAKEANALGCARQSFADSLVSRIHRAEASAYEAAKLRRLVELLDKHPEMREILELVRDLGVL